MNAEPWSWTSMVPSIVTGLAAFFGVVLTNRANYRKIKLENDLQENRRQIELLRDRGEELYVATDKWISGIAAICIRIIPALEGQYSYNDYLDLTIKQNEKLNYDFARIEMIIDVYFPSVRSFYDEVCEQRDQINTIVALFRDQYASGNTNGTGFIHTIKISSYNLNSAAEKLQGAIKSCLQSA